MPGVPRPDNKATKIADAILGLSLKDKKPKRKKRKKAEEQLVRDEGLRPR